MGGGGGGGGGERERKGGGGVRGRRERGEREEEREKVEEVDVKVQRASWALRPMLVPSGLFQPPPCPSPPAPAPVIEPKADNQYSFRPIWGRTRLAGEK